MRILVLGGSFTGQTLAREFPEHEVSFLTRRPDELRSLGLRVHDEHAASIGYDAILDTVPAVPANDNPREPEIQPPPWQKSVEQLLEVRPDTAFVHVSSTSVLPAGEPDSIVEYDEDTPPAPAAARGERRLRLEEWVQRLVPQAIILRAAGIYGPERCVALQFRAGNFSRTATGNQYVSRIHVYDLVRLFLAQVKLATGSGKRRPLVHGVDRRPSPNREVFEFLEVELGIRIPGDWRTAQAQGRMIRSRYALDLLEGHYQYPDYISGFRACLDTKKTKKPGPL